MFFTGALGALFMYSILKSREEHHGLPHSRQAYKQRIAEDESTHQSASERVAQTQARQLEETCRPTSFEQTSLPNATPPRLIYVPREVVREIIVDRSCKCSCKASEKPEVPRSFWSLDQGKFIRSAGNKEAKKMQEKRKDEIAKMTKYWSLDQGMHADEKGGV
ncbi:hypothetical protein E8E12_010878 [Didymella heteroderae]|uniref:Uncharacterized protein n=1 Tax=Didymella heteroderae TaxID=1769908 RepID=A0A9P4X1B4_9PLEO|nr:hypothetical protein E8E12_010878 [Didymella heteroderae]